MRLYRRQVRLGNLGFYTDAASDRRVRYGRRRSKHVITPTVHARET
jgi:hypothetical protein